MSDVRLVFIRYIAHADKSPTGRAAAAFCDILVKTGLPVRLVSTRMLDLVPSDDEADAVWHPYRGLLTTPMAGEYVNLVCGNPWDWAMFWTQRVVNVCVLLEENLAKFTADEDDDRRVEIERNTRAYDLILTPGYDLQVRVPGLLTSSNVLRLDEPRELAMVLRGISMPGQA